MTHSMDIEKKVAECILCGEAADHKHGDGGHCCGECCTNWGCLAGTPEHNWIERIWNRNSVLCAELKKVREDAAHAWALHNQEYRLHCEFEEAAGKLAKNAEENYDKFLATENALASTEKLVDELVEGLQYFEIRAIRPATWTPRDVDECRYCKANDAFKPLEHDKDCPIPEATALLSRAKGGVE